MKTKTIIYIEPEIDHYLIAAIREYGIRDLVQKTSVSSARISNLIMGRTGVCQSDFDKLYKLVIERYPMVSEMYPNYRFED